MERSSKPHILLSASKASTKHASELCRLLDKEFSYRLISNGGGLRQNVSPSFAQFPTGLLYSTLPLLKMGSADDASNIRNMTTVETDLPLSPSQSRQRQRGGESQIFTALTADRRL